jgi:DNA gyrase subunit A
MNDVIEIPIKQHMEKSALDYAMSVIAARALPDVRDGLKPVHRRILWAMHEMGMTPEKQTKKSAGVVGEVLKLYHPHGDTSVYDAAVRMAQPWSLLHPLIIGQGNFGSVDGDGAAAYRYTEMKLAPIAMRFFDGIDKQAVDMVDNFDGQAEEPVVLPVAFPNILVNGSEGIAVGMSTSVPPHNLREVGAAVEAFLDKPTITPAELAKYLTAPDFPTGGVVHGLDGYVQALETGRGRVMLRGTWREETNKAKTKSLLIIDSIPYQQKKSKIHENIGTLVNEKKLEGISDVRDESSSKLGTRLVVELKKDVSAELVFNQLLGHKIGLEVSFNYNMMLLDGTQPVQMNILDIFRRWVAFRIENIQRATQFNLDKAKAHLHLLEGLIKAIGLLDKVIAIVRKSDDGNAAREALIKLVGIDDVQANAILAMTLRKLTGLELEAIRTDHKETVAYVADLEAILASDKRQIKMVREALRKAVEQFGVARQTAVEHSLSLLNREDLINKEDAVVITTANGYVKRVPTSAINQQNRGTRGKSWITAGEDDAVTGLHIGSTHDYLLAITSTGQIYSRKVYEIPESSAGTKGRHIRNIIPGIADNERIVKMLTVEDFDETCFLITVSEKGQVKRTKLSEYTGSSRESGVIALVLDSDDQLAAVDVCCNNDDVILVASNGKSIRFTMDDTQLRPMGRASMGNRGIRITDKDKVVGMVVIPVGTDNANSFLFCMGEHAIGKKTPVEEFTPQARGGQGITCFNITPKTGSLVKAMGVSNDSDLVLISQKGVSNRIDVKGIRQSGRITSGVKLMNLDAGDRVAEVSLVVREPETE